MIWLRAKRLMERKVDQAEKSNLLNTILIVRLFFPGLDAPRAVPRFSFDHAVSRYCIEAQQTTTPPRQRCDTEPPKSILERGYLDDERTTSSPSVSLATSKSSADNCLEFNSNQITNQSEAGTHNTADGLATMVAGLLGLAAI